MLYHRNPLFWLELANGGRFFLCTANSSGYNSLMTNGGGGLAPVFRLAQGILHVFDSRVRHNFGSGLGTYAIHGSLLALWVPARYVAIIGLTIGYFVGGNKITVIKATVGAILVCSKVEIQQGFLYRCPAMLFLLAKVRKEGLMSIEGDIEKSRGQPNFSKYPNLVNVTISWSS